MAVALHCLWAVTSAWSRRENHTCAFILYQRHHPCALPQPHSSRSTGQLLAWHGCDKSMSPGLWLCVSPDICWVWEMCWSPVCQSHWSSWGAVRGRGVWDLFACCPCCSVTCSHWGQRLESEMLLILSSVPRAFSFSSTGYPWRASRFDVSCSCVARVVLAVIAKPAGPRLDWHCCVQPSTRLGVRNPSEPWAVPGGSKQEELLVLLAEKGVGGGKGKWGAI